MKLKLGGWLFAVALVGAVVGCAGPTGGSAPPTPPANLSGSGNFGSNYNGAGHTDAAATWVLPATGSTYSGSVSGPGYTYYLAIHTSGDAITRLRMGTNPTEGVDGEIIETDVLATRVASSSWCGGNVGLLLAGIGPVLVNGVDSEATWAYDLTICNEAAADWFGG